jgi:thymidylate synthase (FAD)
MQNNISYKPPSPFVPQQHHTPCNRCSGVGCDACENPLPNLEPNGTNHRACNGVGCIDCETVVYYPMDMVQLQSSPSSDLETPLLQQQPKEVIPEAGGGEEQEQEEQNPQFVNFQSSFVQCLDHMGTDAMVVNTARVSMHKEIDPQGELSTGDVKLIEYLAKNQHVTPFFHPQIQFRLKMPIFVARQWFKTVVGVSRNEVSRRYVTEDPQFYLPTTLRNKPDNKSVKQGSGAEAHLQSEHFLEEMKQLTQQCASLYNEMITAGICGEQARMILPQNMMTEFIETGSLEAYNRIIHLRSNGHAQKETQEYANCVAQTVVELFPITSSIKLRGR